MKKLYCLLPAMLSLQIATYSQSIGINNDGSAPNPNAMLDVKAFNKGLLIPRTSTTSRVAIPNTKGLLVYDTTTSSFWYNNGSAWNNLAGGGSGWALTGNSGTDTSTNFIGTTDAKPLVIKLNHTISGFVDNGINGNTGLGFQTFFSNTTGKFNTEIGYQALVSNTTGSANTANGYQALYSNTTGSYNTSNGIQALSSNTTGKFNTATGGFALTANTIGNNNTANGYTALYSNTTGYGNTANGFSALSTNTMGYDNIANGDSALYSNTTGSQNTADGYQSLYKNNDGVSNTAVGYQSMYSNTSGYQNSAIGNNALYLNTTGGYNVAVGLSALQNNTGGFSNTATGQRSMFLNTTGGNNTATGFNSLYSNTTGSYNVANGDHAGFDNTTGSNNILIGQNAGIGKTTGDGNICIGQSTTVSNGVSNAIVIGNSLTTSQNNAVVLGGTSQNVGIGTTSPYSNSQLTVNGGSKYYSIYAENHYPGSGGGITINATTDKGGGWGVYGESTGSTSTDANIGVFGTAHGSTLQITPPGSVFTYPANYGIYGDDGGGNGLAGTFNGSIAVYGDVFSSSDSKLKKNIKQLNDVLTRVKQLPVKEFDFDQSIATQTKINLSSQHQFGFIAQDVQKIFPNLVAGITAPKIDYSQGAGKPKVIGSTGFLAVNYISFIPLLTKAVQELSAANDLLQKQVNDLTSRIAALEKK